MNQALLDYFRISPESIGDVSIPPDATSGSTGFFQFGEGNICFGRCQLGTASSPADSGAFDVSKGLPKSGANVQLPFDFAEVIENLRLERYRREKPSGLDQLASSEYVRKSYYLLRSCLPFPIRRQLQRLYFQDWKELPFPAWPVDLTVDTLHQELLRLLMEASGVQRLPFIWFWPEGAQSCLILTHDVETSAGRDFTFKLMDLDDAYGFKAAYQVIPEKRYQVPDEYVAEIRSRGCEFNIHDLNHDGRLYAERSEFAQRAARINRYLRTYGSEGFRAGSMYRRQDWYDLFEFAYDMSVPNVAHLEPLRGGCCTVMPYFIGNILELPLTTAQDYSLFHILNNYSIDVWKQQMSLIKGKNGLMSFLSHPDYLIDPRARKVYEALLNYLRQMVAVEKVWVTLPAKVNAWWRVRNQMRLVKSEASWEIEGPEKERARIAYAVLDGSRLVYEFPCEKA